MANAGVFRVNFNGGEPLVRDDLMEICKYAKSLGFDIHMNTNATLITNEVAEQLALYMPSVCVSLLASTPERHDEMSGRSGAFAGVLNGMDALTQNGVAIEVNVCTTMENFRDLFSIAEVAAAHGCRTFCSTRYILTDRSQAHLVMTPSATLELVEILIKIDQKIAGIDNVSLPGPVPFCELPEKFHTTLFRLNVPCQYGYGLCRVSSTGMVTPCTISTDVIGDLREISFQDAWDSEGWKKYARLDHIPNGCRKCNDFQNCKAGCIVYDESLIASNMRPCTQKWT